MDHAAFDYTFGAQYEGWVDGRCDARALIPAADAAGGFEFAPASYAALRLFEVWNNYTLVLSESGTPVKYPGDAGSRQDSIVLAGEQLRVDWPAGHPAVAVASQSSDAETYEVRFAGASARVGPATTSHDSGSSLVAGANEPLADPRANWGIVRRVDALEGQVLASGDASMYLEEARVSSAGETYDLPASYEITSSGGPGVRFVSERHRYAWLDVEDSSWAAGPGSELFCRGLAANVHGAFTAFSASGHVKAENGRVDFVDRQLTLAGVFDIHEEVSASDPGSGVGVTSASASGKMVAVGLDFVPTGIASGQNWTAAATATLGGVILAGLGAFILYSRISEDRILDRPERRRLYEAIVANPGIEFARLLDDNATSPTNARYHLKLLERRGLVRVVAVHGRHRFMPAGSDANEARRSLLLSEDPKLRDLLSLLGHEGKPASELVDALRREWGLSRTGGWKVLDRAVRAQLVERRVHQRRVILRRAV